MNTAWCPMLQATVQRELLLAVRRPAEWLRHAGFFLMVCALFPLSIRPDDETLAVIGPGVVWVAAWLALLLACGRWFEEDLRSGWLDQCLLASRQAGWPLALWMAARFLAQWLLVAGPLLATVPLASLQYGLTGGEPQMLGVLLFALVLGTAVLVQLAGVAAALAAGLRGGGLLVMLVTLPLAVPPLVLGTLAVQACQQGQSPAAPLSLLGALLALATLACPPLAALALRQAVEA